MVIRFIMSFLATLALNIRFDIPQDMNHLASESKMLNIFYNFHFWAENHCSQALAAQTLNLFLILLL